jgi:Outer membrane protein beta-barrel domain
MGVWEYGNSADPKTWVWFLNKSSHMKKIIVPLVVISSFFYSPSQAQGFHLGIKAGSNVSELTGKSFSDGFNWNFMAGAFAEINFTKTWGIQPEVLFSQTTSQTASNFSEAYEEGINSKDVKLQYLSIPILLTYRLPLPILSLQLGPQFGTLLNDSYSITTNGKNAFKSGDFSMVVGAQINLLMFKGGVRYVYGFTNINDVTDADAWKTRTIQLYVGLRIF